MDECRPPLAVRGSPQQLERGAVVASHLRLGSERLLLGQLDDKGQDAATLFPPVAAGPELYF
ncbi:MAG: hypothetical protein F4025_06370 [Synechococcus sp. SB0669_bin_7]|nr:hypothetical protein [Synechococcus sp. SB0670_bin_20]MYK86021.1 hypothetical protein [Synechococcus sp. SB0669_bin_7]